ncbi:ankyrin repeat, PH and SEC7 domain containing protein secG isoform X1 [Octopus sinensis]|uniref:Ankyrin repeat, PH and SEC7 domain containing protein secG isoform X1 n=1 Tax=Octopus sinensis TaxID=2607531 RepID=A0A6P7SZ32_9MOLL|nr:ankyrin repeat, PH and SEC7 domain containing protein secG isoform X1 [Octopus sinensis]
MEQVNNSDWTSEKEDILRNDYPLHYACREGDVDRLRRLLDEYTATMTAPINLALSNSIMLKEDCFYGWTPAHWAAYFGKLACLQKLSCFNRPYNLKCDMRNSKFQQTPSHLAAYAGHPHCLQWLLQSNAEINARDYLGETPLHKAASTGTLDCVSLLISYQASLGIKNSEGETACSLARKSGFLECARNLEMAAMGSINESRRTVVDDMEVQSSRNLHEKSLSDILMDKEVKKNRKLVGGRKRTLEDLDEGIFKYLRQGDYEPERHSSEDPDTSMPLESERNTQSSNQHQTSNNELSVLESFKAVLSISTEPLDYDPQDYPYLMNSPPGSHPTSASGIFL